MEDNMENSNENRCKVCGKAFESHHAQRVHEGKTHTKRPERFIQGDSLSIDDVGERLEDGDKIQMTYERSVDGEPQTVEGSISDAGFRGWTQINTKESGEMFVIGPRQGWSDNMRQREDVGVVHMGTPARHEKEGEFIEAKFIHAGDRTNTLD